MSAYPYIINHGLASEVCEHICKISLSLLTFLVRQINYPYIEKQGECKDKLVKAVSGITGFRRMRTHDQQNMVHVLHRTPVAVGIAGTASSFLMYRGGIYNDHNCGNTLNHAALLVGYGTTNKGAILYHFFNNLFFIFL